MTNNSEKLPSLVAFDLDYTLWPLYIDGCVGPISRTEGGLNAVYDKYSSAIGFYRDVPQLLHDLSAAGIHIAACSRTSAIALANEALSKLIMPASKNAPDEPLRAADSFFNTKEIYPTSKIKHFKAVHQKTGIPYSEMLFFDDEPRNREVESLGVTFILADRGMNRKLWNKGLTEWRRRQPKEEDDEIA
ncbi:magnesium-dependent phosphatase-1 [Clavulina sp. PMI_390]|nr:magnesium-dependent phosphatase-1 [Clavulina sp. PMI_390]